VQVDAQDAVAVDRGDIAAVGAGCDRDAARVSEARGLERGRGSRIREVEVPLETDHSGQIAEQLDRLAAVDIAPGETE
jgi:hypothetical protein